jgi:catechol 2,3-dioxygenase-like lactoylglutathione lyase family enzyme
MPARGINHVDLAVGDVERSLAFYLEMLEPLGLKEYARYPTYRGTEEVAYVLFGGQGLGFRPADGGEYRHYDVGIEHLAMRSTDLTRSTTPTDAASQPAARSNRRPSTTTPTTTTTTTPSSPSIRTGSESRSTTGTAHPRTTRDQTETPRWGGSAGGMSYMPQGGCLWSRAARALNISRVGQVTRFWRGSLQTKPAAGGHHPSRISASSGVLEVAGRAASEGSLRKHLFVGYSNR